MDRDLSKFRPSKLWRRLPMERRVDAASLFWDDEHSADQQMEAVASIATYMKFRPRSVIALAPGKRARYLDPAVDVALISDARVRAGKDDPAGRTREPRPPERVVTGMEVRIAAARQRIVVPDDRLRGEQLPGFPQPRDTPQHASLAFGP